MRHLTRDFLTLTQASCPGTNMYALAIFLGHCGGFVQLGQTNFDLTAPATWLGHGVSASINGSRVVSIPVGSYPVSAGDVNRILVLKSQLHPKSNSGLFRIQSVNTVANTVTVDYRTSQAPPVEQFLDWSIFENEVVVSSGWQSGSNGVTKGYGSYNASRINSSSCSRIIMGSPDLSGWQVRLCLESLQDISGAVPSGFSIAPGYGGDSAADYLEVDLPGKMGNAEMLHLHGAAWYNTTSSQYRGMTVGLSPSLGTKGQWRISMLVDDVSGTCGIVNNNVSLSPSLPSGSGWCFFGLTEDETVVPGVNNLNNPSVNISRLFVVGSSNPQSNMTWTSQFHVDNNTQTVCWSNLGYPVPGVLSCYSDISNPGNTHVRYLSSSVNTPWMSATELLEAEVLMGTMDATLSAASSALFRISPRRLGRVPIFMQGRANFPTWTTTTDPTSSFYHTQDGIYMEWGGPPPTDAVTGGSNFILNSSSIELQQGLVEYGAFLPGSDPMVPVIPPGTQDIDSTLYRKTYSYFRQVPIIVGVIKGGSNPAKP